MLKYLIYLELAMSLIYSLGIFLTGMVYLIKEFCSGGNGRPKTWLWWNIGSFFFVCISIMGFFFVHSLSIF